MTDLAAFILARLEEDEEAAKRAGGGAWEYRDSWVWCGYYEVADVFNIPDTDETGAHIALHDPSRVLREVAAKRAIIAKTFPLIESEWGGKDFTSDWGMELLRFLALPYSDHPDFRPEWACGQPGIRL